MKRIERYLRICHNKLTRHDWDNVIAVVGDEGVGKSTLVLSMLDYWYCLLNGKCVEGDVRHMCLTRKEWAGDLKDCVKYEMTVYDEAGDITNRRAMANFNVSIIKAYQIIRGDNLFTILVLPSLWELDPFFTKRRLRGLFEVTSRGCVRFWSRDRVRKIMALNQSRYIKKLGLVKPSFHDKFFKYKGVLKESYDKKKKEKMQKVRAQLYKEIMDDTNNKHLQQRNMLIAKLAQNMKTKELSKLTGISIRQLNQIKKDTKMAVAT